MAAGKSPVLDVLVYPLHIFWVPPRLFVPVFFGPLLIGGGLVAFGVTGADMYTPILMVVAFGGLGRIAFLFRRDPYIEYRWLAAVVDGSALSPSRRRARGRSAARGMIVLPGPRLPRHAWVRRADRIRFEV